MYCVVTQEDLPNVNTFLKPPSLIYLIYLNLVLQIEKRCFELCCRQIS